MKTRLHANATTTPKVRADIQASREPVAVLARRHGVSETTIRRWRGRATTEDRSHVRYHLGQATSPEEEALIVELRTRAGTERPRPTASGWPIHSPGDGISGPR